MAYGNALYQQVILDHNKNPRNFRVMPHPTHTCEGHNPLCGDQITVFAAVDGEGRLADLSFQGKGCAISKASASMMTAHLKGKRVEEAEAVFEEFHRLVKGELDPQKEPHQLGKLTLFEGVKEYSSRIKCASLAWHALVNALKTKGAASTEGDSISSNNPEGNAPGFSS